MEGSLKNTTQQNQSNIWNYTEGLYQLSDRSYTNISLGLGCCITAINVTTLYLLLRHRKCIGGTGFWQQLVFLCSTDILTGISITFPSLGFLFFDVHADIYYSLCAFGIFLYPMSVTLSTGNSCIISIYRYVILKYIDKPTTIWHKYSSSLMLLGNGLLCLITVSSSILVVSDLYGFQYKQFCEKVNITGQNEYKSKYIMGSIILFIIFLIGTNVFTILSPFSMNRTQHVNTSSTQSLNMVKRNRYATVTFIIIVFVMNLASIPSLLFVLVSFMTNVNFSTEAKETASRIVCMNSLFNPVIYSLRSTEFRTALWKDIRALISRIRCSYDGQ